jgi:hypothetical protein
MPSSGMLVRVARVRTDVSEERSESIIRVTRIGEPGTLAVTSSRRKLRKNTESVLTRATRRNIPEDGILLSHCSENLKSYTALTGWTLLQRCNVSPVRYELGLYIPGDGILHSHRREKIKSYIELTGWAL